MARRAADEEDVALDTFDSFRRGAEEGRFPQLHDRDNLWRLLAVITARKAIDLLVRQSRIGRGGGRVRGESALLDPAASGNGGIEQVVGDEPTPEFAAQVAEECQRLLDRLGADELRDIAVWKLEGHTSEEVARRLGGALATVERRLRLIRKWWQDEDTGRGERPA